jgi:hypothetical protein
LGDTVITAQYRLRGKRHSGLDDTLTLETETAPDVWTPIDLTGYDVRLQVRTEPYETASLVTTLTAGDGLTVTPAAGRIRIHVDETKSADIPCGSFWYDLRLDPPAGDAVYLVAGPFVWESPVTLP